MKSPRRSLQQRATENHFASISCFLSYASDAQDYARALADILQQYGVKTVNNYTDQEAIHSGDKWLNSLQTSLRHADVLIFIGTPGSLHSKWALDEVRFYSRNRGYILPIMFRGVISFSEVPPFLQDILWLVEDETALPVGPSDHAKQQVYEALQHFVKAALPISAKPLPPNEQEKRPLNEGKLILVGRGEVGKTSLVRRLTKKQFRGDESKTQGINITDWSLQCDADKIKLNVWDFGGQEIMHATHQFFLTEQSLYLLVLNGREGGEDADTEYWLKHIESFGGESPVIVVQNKIAEHPFDLNYRGLEARYPQIRAFVKTDCKENIGIDQLRDRVYQVVVNMPKIRLPLDKAWFSVKQRLESMTENFMGYDSFCQLCHEEGVEDETDRHTLSWVLHCLGIALNYRDDSRLRETSVLRPEWVTQGIYRILNARELAKRQGELYLNDLKSLLPTKQYPLVKHQFLLDLMRKFSLCFPFPDEWDHYLVPELLGKEEPEEVGEFCARDCLNFEYEYGLLPEGLIPRFIVRSHTLSRGQERWRSGVILAYEECKALVTAEPVNRRIIVRVKGGESGGRRRLLAIVRYDLDKINTEFRDRLDAQPKVPLMELPEFSIDYKKLVAFEKQGVKEFPEFIGERVVTVKVSELLNGVDLGTRDQRLEEIPNAKAIFFSYSHKDEALRDELETHLKLLQRQGHISIWHDRKILPGSEWDSEIDQHLERAKIILFLVSADFVASDYCWGKEVDKAMERHRLKEATVIPIMLRSCDWQSAPFGKLQGLPRDMNPITAWKDRDAAWTDVARGIRKIAD